MAFIDEMSAEDRARVYDLLATMLSSAPTEASTSAFRSVAQVLDIPCPDDLSLAEVLREFMDLFVVPNARYVAPYESAYRDRRPMTVPGARLSRCAGLLMGESTLAVHQAFMDAGVRPSRDLPDHIANELRLVSHLWHVEACAHDDDGVEAARQREGFVAGHVLQWIEDLASKISESGETGFYRAAIEAAHALLDRESAPDYLERAGAVSSQEGVLSK